MCSLCNRLVAFVCPVLTCKKTCVYLCKTMSFNCHLFIADHTFVSELGIELQTRASPLSPHKRMTAMMEPFRYYSYLLLSSVGDAVTFTLFAALSWCTAWDNLVTFIWLFNTCQVKCNEIAGEHFCNFFVRCGALHKTGVENHNCFCVLGSDRK